MTDSFAELDAALDRVVTAARAHLEAVKAADRERDDDAVWRAYVALNNASHEYDEVLNDVFGEVTPWDLEEISAEEAEGGRGGEFTGGDLPAPADDPYPAVVSVRQRRDYRVPSVAALLALAEMARGTSAGEPLEPITSVGDAVLELLQSGDGSLGMLDLPELDPLDGVVVVAEVANPLSAAADVESDDARRDDAAFRLGEADRVVGRLDERALPGDLGG
jgi:hypothetical protein